MTDKEEALNIMLEGLWKTETLPIAIKSLWEHSESLEQKIESIEKVLKEYFHDSYNDYYGEKLDSVCRAEPAKEVDEDAGKEKIQEGDY